MTKKVIYLLTLSALSVTTWAGDPGACYSISDADARTYCLAKAHNDPGRCYAIQNSVKRSECQTELKNIK